MHTQILFDWLKKFSSNRVIYYIYKKNKMLRKIFLLLIICSSTVVFSQKKVAQFINSLKTSSSNIKDVIPIVNAENGDFANYLERVSPIFPTYQDRWENLMPRTPVTSEMTTDQMSRYLNDFQRVMGSKYNLTDPALMGLE